MCIVRASPIATGDEIFAGRESGRWGKGAFHIFTLFINTGNRARPSIEITRSTRRSTGKGFTSSTRDRINRILKERGLKIRLQALPWDFDIPRRERSTNKRLHQFRRVK